MTPVTTSSAATGAVVHYISLLPLHRIVSLTPHRLTSLAVKSHGFPYFKAVVVRCARYTVPRFPLLGSRAINWRRSGSRAPDPSTIRHCLQKFHSSGPRHIVEMSSGRQAANIFTLPVRHREEWRQPIAQGYRQIICTWMSFLL